MSDLTIANTIKAQLPRTLAVMIGVKQFVGGPNFLQFGFKAKASNKANVCKISLNGNDLYDVEFFKCRKFDVAPVGNYSDIYAEALGELFSRATGLALSL